jgi:flagellar biosynthesis protein FlhF
MAGSDRDGPFDLYDRTGSVVAEPSDAPSDGAVAPIADEWPAERPAAASSEQIAGLAAQIAEVREMVERISLARVDARVDGGPVALQEARTRLIDQGVGPSVLVPLLDKVADAVVPDATQQMVLQRVERQLAATLPSVVRLDLGRSPLAIFVVGPGGAGKTTLAVRLAVELASQRGARVTLASIDVNRAGAPQQLAAYGAATGLPARPCYSPGELKALLEDGSSEVVIIDTPANSGTRRDRMAELGAFTQIARERATLLALPATIKNEDILRVTSAMGAAGIDGLVLTRCDETEAFGALLTAACEHGIGIAYSTHGEGISDPLRAGDNHALALAIIGGSWPERARSGRAVAAAG